MKITLVCLFVSLNFVDFNYTIIQENNNKELILKYIEEVFKEHSQSLVFDNEKRFQLIKNFIDRTDIISISKVNKTKFTNLINVPLQSKYNKNLVYDKDYNLGQYFNPLKYNLPFFPKSKKYYKIGTSDFLLVIKPLIN